MKKVGVIGCGVISRTYLRNIRSLFSKWIEVTTCADLSRENAEKLASEFDIPKVCEPRELLESPQVEIVLNLTVPAAHYEISCAALLAGKHVYSEKPLALEPEQVQDLTELAEKSGLFLNCAPDTFLSAPLRTCRRLIDEGWIGRPVAAVANMVSYGNETWHPHPDFYYLRGGGPMMDMGPYYITALAALLGPVETASCFLSSAFQKRPVYSKPDWGRRMEVEVPTHYSGAMKFTQGAIASINMSFDVWMSNLPKLEIHGTQGSLILPDPNKFSGEVLLVRAENLIDEVAGLENSEAAGRLSRPEAREKLRPVPLLYRESKGDMRGLGLANMVEAIESGRSNRETLDFIAHISEVLLSFDRMDGGVYQMKTTCHRPPISCVTDEAG